MLMNASFPDHYPPTCPPESAQAPDGSTEYYRLVRKPVSIDSLKSPYELDWPNSDHCDDRALSLYKGPRGVQRLIESYEWANGGAVARIRPEPQWGMLRTGSQKGSHTHTNFWLFDGVDRTVILNAMHLLEEGES